ncbi:hypothetical protein C1645_738404 [Glomus cerebriforme]|uniref:Uncharacterized protein n=1 Tax=Glomus cerebriforme TaxID=658196 RepID=A0A397SXJ9_9GLOM|nr:hypothetical protein C1645_738404 [Glomus cerebriforme]
MALIDKYLSYEECPECKRKQNAVSWCKNCDISSLKDNFCNWTSGSFMIDEFIRETQLNANESIDYLEWIDSDQFDLIVYTKKRGAFSTVYSAMWMEGPKCNLDEDGLVMVPLRSSRIRKSNFRHLERFKSPIIKNFFECKYICRAIENKFLVWIHK